MKTKLTKNSLEKVLFYVDETLKAKGLAASQNALELVSFVKELDFKEKEEDKIVDLDDKTIQNINVILDSALKIKGLSELQNIVDIISEINNNIIKEEKIVEAKSRK